jgi:hypothetical protein
LLERELGLGMQVGRINVTRRQLRIEDKRISQELSSGDALRFSAAIETLIERGAIRCGGIDGAVQAILANRTAKKPVETIVLSSTHRVAERISEKLHEVYKVARPEVKMAQIAAFKVKQLQPAELFSTASYKPGEMIEYQPHAEKFARIAEVATVTADGIRIRGQQELVAFDRPFGEPFWQLLQLCEARAPSFPSIFGSSNCSSSYRTGGRTADFLELVCLRQLAGCQRIYDTAGNPAFHDDAAELCGI